MNTTRIKYLDMDECPRVAFNELLVEQDKDPELVRQAMDEARAAKDEPGVSSSAFFRFLDILAKKEQPTTTPSEN